MWHLFTRNNLLAKVKAVIKNTTMIKDEKSAFLRPQFRKSWDAV